MNEEIGITERGDAALDLGWLSWVRSGKPAILITKNPDQLLKELLDYPREAKKFNIIIHATITGFGGSILEPNVPNQWISITAYQHLIDFYSSDRVVLRIDPIIPIEEGLRIAQGVYEQRDRDPQGRVRISFLDLYPHVKKRFEKVGIIPPWKTFHAPLELRKKAYEELGRPEICGEPDFKCTGCVSEKDCSILKVKPQKDFKGQRKFCACLMNKKELLSSKGQCGHCCVYCYWGKNG
jgi:DNA repair photolyase